MACVCLKNAIDKYWRKTASNSIKEEERVLLKNEFLQYLNEPELKIARQMSVILGKLARFELPLQWPDLIPKLLQILNETNSSQHLVSSRCLMALHAIIKSLASKRLFNDRKVFEELSINIIEMLIRLGFSYVQECISSSITHIAESNGHTDASFKALLNEHSFYMDQAILSLKILHKLVLHGFRDNVIIQYNN
jgi:hypothetical protein